MKQNLICKKAFIHETEQRQRAQIFVKQQNTPIVSWHRNSGNTHQFNVWYTEVLLSQIGLLSYIAHRGFSDVYMCYLLKLNASNCHERRTFIKKIGKCAHGNISCAYVTQWVGRNGAKQMIKLRKMSKFLISLPYFNQNSFKKTFDYMTAQLYYTCCRHIIVYHYTVWYYETLYCSGLSFSFFFLFLFVGGACTWTDSLF